MSARLLRKIKEKKLYHNKLVASQPVGKLCNNNMYGKLSEINF